MKIEASKNHSVEKTESKNVFKTESSVFDAGNSLKTAEKIPQTTGAFAKILEETRKEKDYSTQTKTDSAESDSKTSKSEKEEKVNRLADEKKEADEKNGKNGDSDAQQSSDENQSQNIVLATLQSQKTLNAEVAAPPARAILHIADLERIISTIRTETFQNQKQVTIALKNSVLQGLQIKLTVDENGKVKAEFLALNEQIKKQLKQRKSELKEILGNRSPLFSEIEINSQNQNADA